MKKLNPEQIKKDLGAAKKVSYTPAGAKGLDKLKLAVCRGLRKAVDVALKKENIYRSGKISAIGLLAVGGIEMASLSSGNGGLSDNVGQALTLSAGIPVFLSMAAIKTEKPLRNLEAAILKRIRKNEANPMMAAKVMEQAHAR
jgi:hypothetical protein